jgi:hypothetical protein
MFSRWRTVKIKQSLREYVPIKDYLDQLKALSSDHSLPKFATNLVFLTTSPKESEIEYKIIYSILQKQPKRADNYWFVHVNVTKSPYTCEYKVNTISKNDVYRITFNLGFKVEEKISQFLRIVIEDMVKKGEVTINSPYHSLKENNIAGDFRFVILEEILSPDMYLKEVPTRPGSNDRVEYAIRLPGDGNHPLFLPIDSKFPLEDYYTVLTAYDTNDMKQVDAALKVLETKIERFANDIASKYIEVPYTTNFAVLFLPVEGLFAEAIRRGLVEKLQTKYNVVLAGPTTMSALLNSLQIGFKTLAIQKKSQEVWHVLANARSEFDKFAEVLAKAQEKIQSAGSELDRLIGTRTRMIQSKLKNLETLGANLKIDEQKVDSEE